MLAPSSSPTAVLANVTDSTSIFLEWIPPPNDTHNGVIRFYSVILTEEPTGELLTYVAFSTFKVIQSLHPHYRYKCQVYASTISRGPPSDPIFFETLEDGKWRQLQ